MFIILVNVFLFRLNIDFIFQYYEFLFIGMGEGGRRKSLSIKHFMVDTLVDALPEKHFNTILKRKRFKTMKILNSITKNNNLKNLGGL